MSGLPQPEGADCSPCPKCGDTWLTFDLSWDTGGPHGWLGYIGCMTERCAAYVELTFAQMQSTPEAALRELVRLWNEHPDRGGAA